jgi:hypothetical protein
VKQIANEMKNYKLDILGLSAVRSPDFGEEQTQDSLTFLYSGQTRDDAEHRDDAGLL